jgi:hypothetical protein
MAGPRGISLVGRSAPPSHSGESMRSRILVVSTAIALGLGGRVGIPQRNGPRRGPPLRSRDWTRALGPSTGNSPQAPASTARALCGWGGALTSPPRWGPSPPQVRRPNERQPGHRVGIHPPHAKDPLIAQNVSRQWKAPRIEQPLQGGEQSSGRGLTAENAE